MFALFAVAVLILPLAAAGQSVASNDATVEERESPPVAEEVDEKAIWRTQVICTLGHAAEVQGYRIVCSNASFLDARVADCCIPGDHWQFKLRSYDTAPNTSVTTAPGPANVFGTTARVYNYGGTPQNPRGLIAYGECTYPHSGVNVFPAAGFIDLTSDGNCTVTADPLRARIDRAP
jgi:hypothetical protein